MISFKILSYESENEIISNVLAAIPEADVEEIEEILSSFSDCSDGSLEVAVSAAHGCMLLRIFDGEYLFPYPVALTDTADAGSAADEIRLYAIKEEIPLVFIDVPSEELSELASLFLHTSIDAEDESRDSYTVRVNSELALIDDIPSESCGNLTLNALAGKDSALYFRLSTDGKTNEYWGYDYSDDAPNADGEYFLTVAYEEFARSTALSLAVRLEGKFVGEAIFYAFDLQGGAECAVRLLPEYQGKKIGTKAVDLMIKIACDIGLMRLYATVKNANLASIALFKKRMEIYETSEEKTRFCIYL